MIRFPLTAAEAKGEGELRAGGTDLQDLRHRGIRSGPITDLRDVQGLDAITDDLRIGSLVKIADLGRDLRLPPLIRKAANGLATPQIRAVATLGGNLLQRTRCWYFRSREFDCFKKGGTSCPAREGIANRHALFDRGPCISVHASTLGMAFLAYDAVAHFEGGPDRSIAEVYGDGSDPTRDHAVQAGEVLVGVSIRDAIPGEKGGYLRAIARAEAEWPIVEAGVRLWFEGERIAGARVVAGAVAGVPLRLPAVEQRLLGELANEATFARAAAVSIEGANPVPDSAFKVDFLPAVILSALERAMEA